MPSLPRIRRRRTVALTAVLFLVALLPLARAARARRDHVEPLPTPVPAPASAAQSIESTEAAPPSACPSEMVLVDGGFCTKPDQVCLDWMEDPAQFPYARCARYKEPSRCAGERVAMRFCIDREEHTSRGDGIPDGDLSWTDASRTCAAEGKRLCAEREWTFACEGEEMRPYPYGFTRDPSACNFEQQNPVTNAGALRDGRMAIDDFPACLSPFGVHDMVGNVDEWVVLDRPHYSEKNGGRRMTSGLKGGWWGPLRNRCRPTTVDHDELFHELQTGFRCCADAAPHG